MFRSAQLHPCHRHSDPAIRRRMSTCRTMARVMLPHSNLIAQWKHSPVHCTACSPAYMLRSNAACCGDTQREVLAWRMQISW